MAKQSGLYMIVHSSGAFYVGRSVNMTARFANHRHGIRSARPHNRNIARLIAEGATADEFTIVVLFVCSPDDLKFYEDRALAICLRNPQCLNVYREGGQSDAETRARISRANSGRPSARRGVAVSRETRMRQSRAAADRWAKQSERNAQSARTAHSWVGRRNKGA